jgi:NTP pyrophosphatase (non-canonical NTP hydrolase)
MEQSGMKHLTAAVYQNSRDKGFWTFSMEDGELKTTILLSKIALIGSELGELVEAVRKPSVSEHCPELSAEEEELADIVIRVLDYCGHQEIDIERAIQIKHQYNQTRSYKHGKLA